MDVNLLAILTAIPVFWTFLIFVFFRIVELKGLAFLAAIISWIAWVSVGVTAVEIDVPYNLGIVFLYVLCSIPSFILMIYFIPESWKTSKQEV